MNNKIIFKNIFLLIIFFNSVSLNARLTLIIFVDQLSQHMLTYLYPYFSGGLKQLLDHGVIYSQAYMPHAKPATSPGHASTLAGCLPTMHGITENNWHNDQGLLIKADEDNRMQSLVFAPLGGTYMFGKSAHRLMVDNLIDQFILNSTPSNPKKAYAISLKSRSAIFTAGHLGKALWYDSQGLQFTSSKAYFKQLPAWLINFNRSLVISSQTWQSSLPLTHEAYQSTFKKASYVGKQISRNHWLYSPFAHDALIELAKTIIKHEYMPHDDMILIISFSATDKIAHHLGPHSIEYFDMMLKLDTQLKTLLEFLPAQESILTVLTADHAGMDIPEELEKQGLTLAQRIDIKQVEQRINAEISKIFYVTNIVHKIDTPHVYLNKQVLQKQSYEKQQELVKAVKQILARESWICNVWTYQELKKASFHKNSFSYWYQQQLFPGRSGDIIIQIFPYINANKYQVTTGHDTPYAYDTHIPLILYTSHQASAQKIHTKVYAPQLALTLAQYLEIAQPSAATFTALPTIQMINNTKSKL